MYRILGVLFIGLMAGRSAGVTTLHSLLAAESAPIAASTNISAKLPKFADPAVNIFIQNADAAARVAAPLSPEFWNWVESHPDIHTGLLFAKHPMPAVYAENLDVLRRRLDPKLADKYAHLLLGASLGEKFSKPSEKPKTEWSPVVLKVAAWMKSSNTSYLTVMENTAEALKAANVNPAEAKDKGFWNQVAIASGTYPERLHQSVPDFIVWMIAKLESPKPAGSKLAWPIFPTAKAPWPLMTWFQTTVSAAECEWIWDRYWGQVAGLGSGIIGYGRYSWDYDRVPAIKYKTSNWNPSSLPRIWEDGGVCGRLSTMGDMFRRALGQPTHGCPQPGHRAYAEYGWNEKNNAWTFGIGQSISGLEVSVVSPELPQFEPFEARHAVNCVALVQAMNLGLDRFQRGRILGWFAMAQTDTLKRERYIRQSLQVNPYELSLWKVLSQMVDNGPEAARLLTEMDAMLLTPNSQIEVAEKLSADTDFAKLGGGSALGKSDRGASIAKLTADQLTREMFERLFKAGVSPTETRQALRGEIARRAQMKITYDSKITDGLLAKYDIKVDGLPASLQAAREAVVAADQLKGKPRSAAIARVTARLQALRDAEPKQTAEWAGSMFGELVQVGIPRWSLDKKGKPQPDELYAAVHSLRIAALKRLGKSAKPELVEAERVFEKDKPAPVEPPKK